MSPLSREVLDIKLPYVADDELDTMVEKRADELAQRLDAERIHHNSAAATSRAAATLGAGLGALRGGGGATTTTGGRGKGGDGRGTITVQFFEKRRRKAWYGAGRDEEVCWESWTVRVTVAEPRTESGRFPYFLPSFLYIIQLIPISFATPLPNSTPPSNIFSHLYHADRCNANF